MGEVNGKVETLNKSMEETQERTRRNEADSRKSTRLDMLGDLLADFEIRACQVEAGLTGRGMTAERHDENILGFEGSQTSPANLARLEHGQRVTEIESLPLRVTVGSVINRQSRD